MRWDILTGEYPPRQGGVGDYTRQVARALAAAGDEVHVWTAACPDPVPASPGVAVHRLPGQFGPWSLRACGRGLTTSSPRIVLVQYVPHAYGWQGANLGFCLWLRSRRRETIWTCFHEVRVPFDRTRGPGWNFLAMVTRVMAAVVARASARIYISTPAWQPLLMPFARTEPEWLPVPSNLPVDVARAKVLEIRARLAPEAGAVLIGHFSSYSSLISPLLCQWLGELLSADDRRIAVLAGYRAKGYASDLVRGQPSFARRVRIAAGLPAQDAAAHLAACDLIVQPYPDGATTRRTTLMAALALGMPVLTNAGPLTEPFWRESGAAVFLDGAEKGGVARAADRLLRDPEARAALGARAASLYRHRFSVERLAAKLRSDAAVDRAES